jgi:WD40 repeat protein
LVISGSLDQTLRLLDIESGETIYSLILDAPVTALAVEPSSRTVIAGDSSGRVHFFDFVEP